MIGVGFQPSLSSAYRHKATGSRTSAFLLQTLPQSRIMVGFGNDLLPRVEGTISPTRTGDSQIAHSHINPYYAGMGFGSGVCYFHLKRNQQIELLLGLIVPEFRGPGRSTLLNESDMLAVSRVGH